MTSVDSGVETGNDSNDSTVVTATTINQQTAGDSVTTVATTKQTDKQHDRHHQQQQQEAGSSIIRIDFSPVWSFDLRFPISSLCPMHMESYYTSASCLSGSDYYVSDDPVRHGMMNMSIYDNMELSTTRRNMWVSKEADSVCRAKRRLHRKFIWKGCYFRNERRMRLAAATNNTEYMKKLLENGISPNNHDEHGRTPLHHAACRGYTDMVHLLLEYGADPNRRDCIGNTPLHLAAVTSKISVVTLLLIAGTDVLSLDQHGYNPLQLAQTKLKMIQNCNNKDMEKIKKEMHDIVDMLVAYLQKQRNMREQVETLSNFCSRLTLSNTSDQIQDDVKDLLASIETLSIT